MSAIQQTLPPLIGGVSEAIDSQASPNSVRVCDNFMADLVWGLSKRSGSEFISEVPGSNTGSYFNVKLGDQENYLIHIGTNGITSVSDALSGEQYTVGQQASTYLTHKAPGELEVLQTGDFVFVLNRTVTAAKAAATSPDRVKHAWVELRALSYETTYRVAIRASGASTLVMEHTTPASGSLNVRGVLVSLVATLPSGGPWTVQVTGNIISIIWTDPTDTRPILVEVSGGRAANAIVGYSGRVSSVEELPSVYYAQRPVLVKPTNSTGEGYWVEYNGVSAIDEVAGTWSETLQPSEQYAIQPATMPHAIVRLGDGSWIVRPLDGISPIPVTVNVTGVVTSVSTTGPFNGRYWLGQTFFVRGGTGKGLRLRVLAIDNDSHPTAVEPIRPGSGFTNGNIVLANNGDSFTVTSVATVTYSNPSYANERWTDRTVGSLASVPWPTFVDRKITGIGFYLNRLTLLSEDSVISSKAGDYLNFFPTTAIQVLADDPIDVNTGETTRTVLRHAIDYNDRLICIAEDRQFSLRGGDDGFTPTSAKLTVSSRVKTSTVLKPLATQVSWLLAVESNTGVELVEMFPNADDDPNLARPNSVSLQVPTYIPRGVFTADIEEELGFAVLTSRQNPKAIYVWQWKDQSRQRLLSAWSRITLPMDIEHLYFEDSVLFAVGRFNSRRILLRIPMGVSDPAGRVEFEGFLFNPRLDLMDFTLNVNYSQTTDQTTIQVAGTLYDTPSQPPKVFVLSGPNKFVYYEPEYQGGNLILPGNVGSTDVVLGYDFMAEALMQHIYLRGGNGEAIVANAPKVRRVMIRSFRSGGFGASITVPGRDPYTKDCGQALPRDHTLGQLIMKRIGEVTVPTLCDGDDMDLRILSSCPLPVNIQEVTWKGTYTTKGLRSS